MGPEDLAEIIAKLSLDQPAELLVGVDTSDDAGIFMLSPDLALVQTLDFITPIVDDPFVFGRIAAANSISDIYAMGGEPLTALNVCCFPAKGIPKEHLARILEGGFEVMREAGVALAGGHTIKDNELKYGLSVTGRVHPEKVLSNAGARPGNRLILTKPLGTAAIFAGHGQGALADDDVAPAITGMATLNRTAAEALASFVMPGACDRSRKEIKGVHALTDVTGFGLAGHALEIARASQVGVEFTASDLPAYPHARAMIEGDFLCGGSRTNRKAIEKDADFTTTDETGIWLACDAQTSGGLLIAVSEDAAEDLLSALHLVGVKSACFIGRTTAENPGKLVMRP
jgi:selenide,water dikinase